MRYNYGPWTYGFGFYEIHQINLIQHNGTTINNHYENGADILSNNSTSIMYFYVNKVEVFEIKK